MFACDNSHQQHEHQRSKTSKKEGSECSAPLQVIPDLHSVLVKGSLDALVERLVLLIDRVDVLLLHVLLAPPLPARRQTTGGHDHTSHDLRQPLGGSVEELKDTFRTTLYLQARHNQKSAEAKDTRRQEQKKQAESESTPKLDVKDQVIRGHLSGVDSDNRLP